MTEEPLLSTAELCAKLGVTRQAIYKWRNLTDYPMPVAIDNTGLKGKTIRYLFSDVAEWLNGAKRKGKVLR
jgi:predicted DNA-binding transcriptional regulator AlpA